MMQPHIRCAEMLFAGETQAVIGEVLGVSERTIAEWSKRLDVKRLIDKYRAEAVARSISETTQRLGELQGQAIETIAQIMNDAESPTPIRLNAARELLKISPPITNPDITRLKQIAIQEDRSRLTTECDKYFSALLENFYDRCKNELSPEAYDEMLCLFPSSLSDPERSSESEDD